MLIILILILLSPVVLFAAEDAHHGESLPIWSIIPFVLMLGAIAFIPLVKEHWWENNNNKLLIALILGIPTGIYVAVINWHELYHTMIVEYIPFILLLYALFVVSGGIVFRSNLQPKPLVNTAIIALGSLLASFMGTTGASMVLIRPMIKLNESRKNKSFMIIFFIFLVSNIGGCLTPLGDPPLFMGYLKGVPFAWTFNLFYQWMIAVAIILVIYYIWDTIQFKKESIPPPSIAKPGEKAFATAGNINFLWLAGIVLSVAFLPKPIYGIPAREVVLLLMVFLSLKTTPKVLREENKFTYNPIIEVAYLFFGLFLTMIPALILLKTRGGELGVTEPWQFFWMTGTLSSFLDNTPTYLVFFELARSLGGTGDMVAGVSHTLLVCISLGAVFMGAMTYIGNAPNFMVKVIAEESKIKMPSFLGYMVWSILILIPVFLLFHFFYFIHL